MVFHLITRYAEVSKGREAWLEAQEVAHAAWAVIEIVAAGLRFWVWRKKFKKIRRILRMQKKNRDPPWTQKGWEFAFGGEKGQIMKQ